MRQTGRDAEVKRLLAAGASKDAVVYNGYRRVTALGVARCGALLPNVDAIEDQDDEAAIRDARKGERYKRIVEMLTAPVT